MREWHAAWYPVITHVSDFTERFQQLAGWRMDLTLAARMLIRHSALSAVAVLGITVAIAMTVTMFTIIGEQLSPSELPLPAGNRTVALQKWDPARNQQQPLGAGGRRILWTMFSRATVQVLAGAALGTAVAALADRAADGALMSGQAVMATAGVVLLMTITGLLAALGPARRGLGIDPTEASRDSSR